MQSATLYYGAAKDLDEAAQNCEIVKICDGCIGWRKGTFEEEASLPRRPLLQ